MGHSIRKSTPAITHCACSALMCPKAPLTGQVVASVHLQSSSPVAPPTLGPTALADGPGHTPPGHALFCVQTQVSKRSWYYLRAHMETRAHKARGH